MGGSGFSAAPAAAGAGPTGRAAHERSESRRLRADVARLKGCLGVLPELARHLIEMRAGIDGPAMTRRAAAKELQIGVARARRIERRGLRAMRRASRQGLCGGAGASTGFRSETVTAALIRPAVSLAATPAAAAVPSHHAKEPARQGVAGVTATSTPPAPKPGPLPGSRVALSEPAGHGHTLVISLVLLLLAANLLAGGVWLLRRRGERDSLAAATGRRRPYADPGHELRFGPEGNEAPERPPGGLTPEYSSSEGSEGSDPDRW
jgi:sigma-70-like protein